MGGLTTNESVDTEVKDGFSVRSLAITYHDGFIVGSHDHPWGQLVYGTSGVMAVTANSKVWFVPPTRAVWLPPLRDHSIAMQGDVNMRTLYLAPSWAATLMKEVTALEVSALLRELILHIHDLEMLSDGVAKHDRLAKVLVDVIADAPAGKLFLSMPMDSRAFSAAEWIQVNPGSRLQLNVVAKQHGCSLRTLQRLFVKETGLTLEAWRQKTRLIFSVSLISSGTNVTQAALECGYDSLSAFIAAFKKQFGVTPGRYVGDQG